MGLTFHLNEYGREAVLKELIKNIQRYMNNDIALIALLREIAVLCRVLGEAVITFREDIMEALMLCLKHSNEYVRFVGALCIRALAESIPQHTQTLLATLVNMVQITHGESSTTKENDLLIRVGSFHHFSSNLVCSYAWIFDCFSCSYICNNKEYPFNFLSSLFSST